MEFSMLALGAVVATPFRSCGQQIEILRAQQPAKLLCVKVVFIESKEWFLIHSPNSLEIQD